MGADGSGGKYLNIPSSGVAILPTDEARAKHETYIKMDGKEVYKFAVKVMGRTAEKALERAGLSYEDIDSWFLISQYPHHSIGSQTAPPSHGKSLCQYR